MNTSLKDKILGYLLIGSYSYLDKNDPGKSTVVDGLKWPEAMFLIASKPLTASEFSKSLGRIRDLSL